MAPKVKVTAPTAGHIALLAEELTAAYDELANTKHDLEVAAHQAVAHGTEVIRLAGVIAHTATVAQRQAAQRFIEDIRKLAHPKAADAE